MKKIILALLLTGITTQLMAMQFNKAARIMAFKMAENPLKEKIKEFHKCARSTLEESNYELEVSQVMEVCVESLTEMEELMYERYDVEDVAEHVEGTREGLYLITQSHRSAKHEQ